jgi:hypothetical protein
MVPGGNGGGHKGGNYFYTCILERILLKWNNWPISIKLGTNISCMMGIQVYSNEGPRPLQREDNHKSTKNRVESFKYFLLVNHGTIKAEIYLSASWYSAESIIFNWWPPRVMRGHNRVKHIYMCFNGENLWKSLKETTARKKVWILIIARWSNGNKEK